MNVPQDLRYTESNEWVLLQDSVVIVGITDYAQHALGDITFVELPEIEKTVRQFEQLGALESVKIACDIFSPLSGEVCEVNKELESSPELINKDPYGKGWYVKLKNANPQELDNLLNAGQYEKYVQGKEEQAK